MAVDYNIEPCSLFPLALQLSQEMKDMAEQHNWDGLIHHYSHYLPTVERILENIDYYMQYGDENVINSLRMLCDTETYVMTLLNARMLEIGKIVTQMRNNKRVAKAYTTQMLNKY